MTHQLVIDTLATLNATKAVGPDELNNKILKEARFHLGEVVADLFNASLSECFVPSQWKQSNIISIPKVPNPTKPNECRPVRLLSRQERRQSHRRLGTRTGQKEDNSRGLLRLQQSVRPGESQEADAKAEDTATTIPHFMDSRMTE
jgi:hypothetical protein